jgi:tellurite resistance protein TerC
VAVVYAGSIEITHWHWVGFIACVLVFLALDLGVFHRKAHVVRFGRRWLGPRFGFDGDAFALALRPLRGEQEAFEFLTGYLIELSLSMDNVFVIALISLISMCPVSINIVCFSGDSGHLIMRGVMIGFGVALISWLSGFYMCSALLCFSPVFVCCL